MDLTRRTLLKIGAGSLALLAMPRFAIAAAHTADTRLVVVLLRGALDGLHAMPRPGDADYLRLRGALGEAAARDAAALGEGFALHAALPTLATLYRDKALLPVVAVAPPYRRRSHFEAQDNLENGTAQPGSSDGWLNRLAGVLHDGDALSVTAAMPLILRGPAPVDTWSPPLREEIDPVLMQRLQMLYAADPALAPAFTRMDGHVIAGVDAKKGRLAQSLSAAAARMSAANGPRIAFVEDTGWDTHSAQANTLARKLAELDAGIGAFQSGATAVWPRTVIVVLTEFGRTAAANGTGGTDHGTGGVAFVAGGAVAGGSIAGQWPGLAQSQLNEGRDLLATTDLRGLLKGIIAPHFGLGGSALERVFPQSAAVPAMNGLLRTMA